MVAAAAPPHLMRCPCSSTLGVRRQQILTVSHISSPWNYAVTFLALRYGDQQLATGSGFFWGHGRKTFLVTNWHNLAGRDPVTRQPISSVAGVPDRVLFSAYKQTTVPDADGFFG